MYDFSDLPNGFDPGFDAAAFLRSIDRSDDLKYGHLSVVREEDSREPIDEGPTLRKSLALAILAGRTALKLCETRATFPVGDQLLRSSASVGANVEEANGAYNPREFAYRMSIALREARETRYWVRYAFGLQLIDLSIKDQIHDAADELVRLLARIVTTTRQRYAIKPKK